MQLIADYKLQLDNQLKKVSARNQKINIQGDIRENTFRLLQKYYAITLQCDDLKAMDRYLLETIDYEKIKFLKGSERMSLQLLKKLMVSHSINCQ